MFLYFDKSLALKTKIDHGERPRQGSDLNITVCLDADFWKDTEKWGVNGNDLWILKLILTVPDKTQSVDYFTSDKGELRVFEKLYESEIVYDLVPGTSYYMYDFHFSAKDVTQQFGKLTANLYFVRSITTDDYVKLASADQWETNYPSVVLEDGEVGISYGSEYKKFVGDGYSIANNLTKESITSGLNAPDETTSTDSGYYYETSQQSVWIFKKIKNTTPEEFQWVRALQFLPDDNVLGNFDETKAFGSVEIIVEKTVGYAQRVIDQLISIKYEDIMREFAKVYAAINIAGTRPDWIEENTNSPAFILNKPDIEKMHAELEAKLNDNLMQTALISPDKTYIVWEGNSFSFSTYFKAENIDSDFEIDFGDGTSEKGESGKTISHNYTDGVDHHLISVNKLYARMFQQSDSVISVHLGKNVKSIPEWTFGVCTNLETIVIPDESKGLETIGRSAFDFCIKLKNLQFSRSTKKIDEDAFFDCLGLTDVKLGENITEIGDGAFLKYSGMGKNYTVSIDATTPPTFFASDGQPFKESVFDNNSKTDSPKYLTKIFVPESAYEAYKTAWSAYADKIAYKVDNSHLTSKVDKLNSDSTDLTEKSDVNIYAQITDRTEGFVKASESDEAHTLVKRGANKAIKIGDATEKTEATSLGQLNTARDDLNGNIAIDPNKTYILFVGKSIVISCADSYSNYQIDMGDGTIYPKSDTEDKITITHNYDKNKAHLISISGMTSDNTFGLMLSGTDNQYRIIQFAYGIKKVGNVLDGTVVDVCVLPENLIEITNGDSAFFEPKVVYCSAKTPPTLASGVFTTETTKKIFVKQSFLADYENKWEKLKNKLVYEIDSSDIEDFQKISSRLISHISNTNNPHKVTKEQVGLGNVDNTSDEDKPISKATQAALDKKIGLDGGAIVGDMKIQGNLIVQGTATYENIQSLNVKDAIIVTNIDGEALGAALSGLVIKKNSSKVYGLMYDPTDDTVKFGEGVLDAENKHFTFSEYEGKPIATRADSKDLVEAHIIIWDSYLNTFVDGGLKLADLAKSSVFDLKHSKIQNSDSGDNKEDSWGTKESDTDLTIYSKTFYIKDDEQHEKYTGLTVGDGYINASHTGGTGSAKAAMVGNEFMFTSSDDNGKTTTVEITPDGAEIDNYGIMTTKGGTFVARPKVQENDQEVSIALLTDIANFLTKQSVGDNYSCLITNTDGAFKIEITKNGEQSATHSLNISKDGVKVDNDEVSTAGKLNKLLAQIDENIIVNPEKTYILFGGTTFAAPQVAYDIDFGDGMAYDKQSAINHTYTDGFDYHIITISTGTNTTFSLGANSTTLGSDASFRIVHFAEGLTNIETFGEGVPTEVAIFPSTVTVIGANILNKVDLVYINANIPPTRGTSSLSEAKKIFVKRTSNTIYKNAEDWLILANNIVHEIDSSDIIGAGLTDEDIARSVTLSNPTSATNGTLTESELATLMASNLNFIIFNNEIYYLADKGHTEGIVSYTHNGWNGSAIQNKSINITLSTRAWTLVTGATNVRIFVHNFYIKGTDSSGNVIAEIRFKRISANSTKITSIEGLATLIQNNVIVEASGYWLTGGNYFTVPWIKNSSLFGVPASSSVGSATWNSFSSMTCTVEDTVDVFDFAK